MSRSIPVCAPGEKQNQGAQALPAGSDEAEDEISQARIVDPYGFFQPRLHQEQVRSHCGEDIARPDINHHLPRTERTRGLIPANSCKSTDTVKKSIEPASFSPANAPRALLALCYTRPARQPCRPGCTAPHAEERQVASRPFGTVPKTPPRQLDAVESVICSIRSCRWPSQNRFASPRSPYDSI